MSLCAPSPPFDLGEWSDYVAVTTGFTKGNGVVVTRKARVGGIAGASFEFILGSSSAVAVGSPTVSLPYPAAAHSVLASGMGWLTDTSANTSVPAIAAITGSLLTAQLTALLASGTYLAPGALSATLPFTWAVNDAMRFMLFYEVA